MLNLVHWIMKQMKQIIYVYAKVNLVKNVEQMKKNFISKIRKNLLRMLALMNIINFTLIAI